MERLFKIGIIKNANGEFIHDQKDIDTINHYLEADDNREIYKTKQISCGEILVFITDC